MEACKKLNIRLFLIIFYFLVSTIQAYVKNKQPVYFTKTQNSFIEINRETVVNSAKINYRQPIYASKTPYRFIPNTEKYDGNVVFYAGKKCRIENVNLFIRHGSRTPQLFVIKSMNKLHAKLKSIRKVVQRFPLVGRWQNPFPESMAYTQLEEGDREQILLAISYGRMFQDLFNGNLDRIKYFVTNTTVSVRSYEAFTHSIKHFFQSNVPPQPPETIVKKLSFFGGRCKNFQRLDNMAKYQYNLFLNGSEMKKVLNKVQYKLGTTNITAEDVLTLQLICTFELEVFDNPQWCTLFDIDELQVIEYLYALKRYWKDGPGFEMNKKIMCRYTSRLFKVFDSIVNNTQYDSSTNVADINFGHNDALISLHSVFGLNNDYLPLLASNYNEQKERLFKVGVLFPMSGNIGVALYKCEDGDYVVKMFVNEEFVIIPKCGSYVCSYKDFKRLYQDFIFCDLDTLCQDWKET